MTLEVETRLGGRRLRGIGGSDERSPPILS